MRSILSHSIDEQYQISHDLSKEESQQLRVNLDEYNSQFVGPSNFSEIGLALRDDAGVVIGGLIGSIVWDWLHVNVIVVSEKLRGKGYGSQLMSAGEQESINRGCKYAKLHTFGFQARPFYEGLGYRVISETKDFPKGSSQFLLFKELL